MTPAVSLEAVTALLARVREQLVAGDAVGAAQTAEEAVTLCGHSVKNIARVDPRLANELLELHRCCVEAAGQLQAQLKGSVAQTGLSRRAIGAYGQEIQQAPSESEGQ